MRYAYDEHKDKISAYPKQKANCPNCGSIVTSKCGSTNVWHWAHQKDKECDFWNHEPITEWHLEWQNRFKEENREVYIKKENITHRADICTAQGIVIEIQNSPLSSNEIIDRTHFYEKIVWVINSNKFKHNLSFSKLDSSINYIRRCWSIIYIDDDAHIKIEFRVFDFSNEIKDVLIDCGYRKTDEGYWIKKATNNYKIQLDEKLYQTISNFYLDDKIIELLVYRNEDDSSFKWKNLRRTWLEVEPKRIYLDLNNDYLFHIKTLHSNGSGYGKFVSKEYFIREYNK